MWLFPDVSRIQIKNLEAACTACTACCRGGPRGSYHLACILAIVSTGGVPLAPPLGKGSVLVVGNRHQFEIFLRDYIGARTSHGVGIGFYHFDRRMTEVNVKQVNQ